ncbi:beta-1,3-galactosyltransferase 1 [Drosophila guanche]|uniref:Hexosyltransferase n=1 Tax=Drosophila guanche TaxID=7266 RepID=A0A3B0JQ04_DROGU|nr:beta-1,3-galactosyltransferase 1 [Drosophila guanche]SPP75739.1 blast:Lactosylceramide 1%2C3-N-acetyl-beta-D-glucosaminyltransferase A [Drosophila guanche]
MNNAWSGHEEQCALLADSSVSSGSTASVSDEETTTRQPKGKRGQGATKLQWRPRLPLPRSLRRLGCYTLMASFIFLLLLVYLPLMYMDVHKRRVGLPDWTLETSRSIGDYIDPVQETALIVPREFCRNKTFLVIAVCTSLGNFVQRQTIRETWGNTSEFNYGAFVKMHGHLKGNYLPPMPARLKLYADYLSGEGDSLSASVRVVFIVGRSKYESLEGNETLSRVHSEAEQYNDIIQESFVDSYNNLTLKSVMALKHISRSCANSTAYFLKCDDDTFVNVPNLLHFLLGGSVPLYNDTLDYHDRYTYLVKSPQNRLNDTNEVMYGHQFCNVVPVNDVSSKWYMPSYMYPPESYPKYLSGAGYLLSIDVVQRLYEASLNTTLVYLEDVYITGLCAQHAHIKRHHHPLFSFAHSKHLCAYKGSITQHQLKDDTMVEAWNYVSDYKIRCPPPGKYFNHMRLHKRPSC